VCGLRRAPLATQLQCCMASGRSSPDGVCGHVGALETLSQGDRGSRCVEGRLIDATLGCRAEGSGCCRRQGVSERSAPSIDTAWCARIRGRCFSSVMLRGVGRGRVAQVVRLGRQHEVSESNPPSTVRTYAFLTTLAWRRRRTPVGARRSCRAGVQISMSSTMRCGTQLMSACVRRRSNSPRTGRIRNSSTWSACARQPLPYRAQSSKGPCEPCTTASGRWWRRRAAFSLSVGGRRYEQPLRLVA